MAHNTIQEAIDSLLKKKNGNIKQAVYAAKIVQKGSLTEYRREFWKDVVYELKKLDLLEQLNKLNRDDC